MWQDTFDEETIKRELSWANKRLRMNSLRVFLHILVWMDDTEEVLSVVWKHFLILQKLIN